MGWPGRLSQFRDWTGLGAGAAGSEGSDLNLKFMNFWFCTPQQSGLFFHCWPQNHMAPNPANNDTHIHPPYYSHARPAHPRFNTVTVYDYLIMFTGECTAMAALLQLCCAGCCQVNLKQQSCQAARVFNGGIINNDNIRSEGAVYFI